ncbi:unnamed protein product [Citrullus colocynthis]|uniref:Uncharacterized protein n=1 Tax=Citrullus colocynthis TaxID=252529 RepID=A0ABP0YGV2_9ROSI
MDESSDGLKDKRRGLTGEKSKRGERFLQKKKEKAIFIPSACDMNHKRGEEIGEVNLKLEKKCNERGFAFVMGVMKLWNSVGFCQILEWKGEGGPLASKSVAFAAFSFAPSAIIKW